MLTLRGEHFYFWANPLYTRGLGKHLANKLQVIPLGGLGGTNPQGGVASPGNNGTAVPNLQIN